MRLDRLLRSVAVSRIVLPTGVQAGAAEPQESARDLDVRSVHCRSQNVSAGGLFVAVKGFSADGHDFIDDAVARGAVAVVTERPAAAKVPLVVVDDSRRALARISAEFFGRPARRLVMAGVTGTNGKTTTVWLLEGIFKKAGLNTGAIGTIGYRYGGRIFDNPVTTPESIDLQRVLAAMADSGVTHVAMEVSSHGLALHRIEGCPLDVGIFTNLSQDHLDFHGSMDAYWECKKTLFSRHLGPENPKPERTAVINIDDPRGAALAAEIPGRVITTGTSGSCQVRAESATLRRRGIRAELVTAAGRTPIESALVGSHNLANILSAAGAAAALKIPLSAIAEGIASVARIPGRLEAVQGTKRRFVFVDYAHTPDALANVLTALREISRGRLICLFGCGGDRDRGKRPQMGAIAAQMSDLAIVTSDNPRNEDPMDIIEEICAGIEPLGKKRHEPADLASGFTEAGYTVAPDRRIAIELAEACSAEHDTVLIAGKGHETYQIIGNQRLDFDDRKEAMRVFS